MILLGYHPPKFPNGQSVEEYGAYITKYTLAAYKSQYDPRIIPFELGDKVRTFLRPSDINQDWIVEGIYYDYFNGWKLTLTRGDGCYRTVSSNKVELKK